MTNTEFIDIRTADRDEVQLALTQNRERIMKELCQLRIEVNSVNQNRFKDNPIKVKLEFSTEILFRAFDAMAPEKQEKYLSELFDNED